MINEWMAANTTLADPSNGSLSPHFDDWFELYNPGTNDVDLAGYYLTDDLAVSNKWVIPNGKTITAGGYLLVWADEEASANNYNADLHANFKLN
ncbi:MAG: hypothetical protein DME26_15765, partial [Verrucomicrobia bacterium]